MTIFEYKSKISKGNPTSLRTTIPKEVSQFLGVKLGDSVKWTVEVKPEGTTVTITKLETQK